MASYYVSHNKFIFIILKKQQEGVKEHTLDATVNVHNTGLFLSMCGTNSFSLQRML